LDAGCWATAVDPVSDDVPAFCSAVEKLAVVEGAGAVVAAGAAAAGAVKSDCS